MTSDREATPADDEFHAFDPSEWWHIETVWFAFTVPDRALNTVIYLINRPAMGVCALQINIFDPSGHEPWNNRHWRSLWHLPLQKSLKQVDMPDVGFKLDVIEPLSEYRVRYEHDNVRFDVTWRALVPPRMANGDHIDQFGRVTGTLVLDGETIPVDCIQMRDRSWKRRSDLEGRRGAYTYALCSAESGILMSSSYDGDVSISPPKGSVAANAAGGWLLRDGRMVGLARSERRVLARGAQGQPLQVEILGIDLGGREFLARGECVSRSIMHTSGNILSWDSVVRWELDGQVCWGEDQDVFTPQTWGDFPVYRQKQPAT